MVDLAEAVMIDTGGAATRQRILVVEDDLSLATILRYNLAKQGYQVDVAHDGLEGLRRARLTRPDLVILDLMLPSLDGQDVCRYLRRTLQLPIIIVTALGDEEHVVAGLAAGADDYVTKPFSMRELLARVAVQMRRKTEQPSGTEALVSGDLVIVVDEQSAFYAGRELRLPPKEFQLLLALAQQPGKVLSRADLMRRVWGPDVVVDPRNVDVHIRQIRAQLEGEPDGSWLIRTVHGVGYRFVGEPGPAPDDENRATRTSPNEPAEGRGMGTNR